MSHGHLKHVLPNAMVNGQHAVDLGDFHITHNTRARYDELALVYAHLFFREDPAVPCFGELLVVFLC